MRQIFFLIPLLLLGISCFAQDDDEESPTKFCNEEIDKKAMGFYVKGIDKKKYKKPERLEFLTKSLQIEPDFAEANLMLGLEIIVRLKLEEAPFAPAVPFFLRAIAVCPQIHSEPYYYIGFHYYEIAKNDSAKYYLQKFLEFPINIYNCDMSSLSKGDAHFYSFFSLVIYMIRHY